MILSSNSWASSSSKVLLVSSSLVCPCSSSNNNNNINSSIKYALLGNNFPSLKPTRRRRRRRNERNSNSPRWKWIVLRSCANGGRNNQNLSSSDIVNSAAARKARMIILKRFSDEHLLEDSLSSPSTSSVSSKGSNFASFQEDPIVDKLRTQLGVIHPLPSPPVNRSVLGLFVFFFFVGVVFDKVWTSRKRSNANNPNDNYWGIWRPPQLQVPTSLSIFLEKDLQRKESVEWVNMVLGKLWKVYRSGLENWLIGLLQPVIDNLKKPDYVQRVEIKQFSLGDEPLSVRSVERRTSRRANDLQYQIGLRYTGGARMLLLLSLKFGIVPIAVPVGVRDFDIDGELWVKLRLIPAQPWVGAVSWAFVSLPKIKFELSPFRLFNLMTIPVLSMFLTKLLTEDLPKLFVRPKKIVLDFEKGKAVGPVPGDLKSREVQEGHKDFAGELSLTLIDARKLSYFFYGKTDPYVVLNLGDQVIRSKKNSQTTVIGPPGQPIWNQDFHLLVENPRKQKLNLEVRDFLGFSEFTIGKAEVDLGSLEDTVPTDRIVNLQGGWSLFRKGSVGEILLRLTYKAYVEDEEDDNVVRKALDTDVSDDELSDSDEIGIGEYEKEAIDSSSATEQESFMDLLAALIVSEEFQGIVASETGSTRFPDNAKKSTSRTKSSKVEAVQQTSDTDTNNTVGGSALFWLGVITSIAVLIAINVGGTSIFNP